MSSSSEQRPPALKRHLTTQQPSLLSAKKKKPEEVTTPSKELHDSSKTYYVKPADASKVKPRCAFNEQAQAQQEPEQPAV